MLNERYDMIIYYVVCTLLKWNNKVLNRCFNLWINFKHGYIMDKYINKSFFYFQIKDVVI